MQKKWMKGLAAAGAALMLAGAFAGCGGGEKKADAPAGNSAKIGFITAYTGPGAAYGVAMKEGVDLAVEEINKNPNTKVKIDLYTYDTKLVKNEAINAMKKAIEQDKVLAIEGPMTTGEMMAAGPIAQQSGVVAFGTGTTGPGITDIGDYIFRNAIPGAMNIPQIVEKTHEKLGYKKIAIMYSNNNDQMVGEHGYYLDVCKKLGLDIVADVTFADKDTDFSAQLTQIQAANPDVIAIAGSQATASTARNTSSRPAKRRTAPLSLPRGIRNARPKRRRISAKLSWRSTIMNRISSQRRLTTRCTPSTPLWNSPAPPRTARSSAIRSRRSKTLKARRAPSPSTNTAIRRWIWLSSKSKAASGSPSLNERTAA